MKRTCREYDKGKSEVNEMYRDMCLTTGQYNQYFTTCYLFDFFMRSHRVSFFSVCVLIKTLLVSRQKLQILFIVKSENLFLKGNQVSLFI